MTSELICCLLPAEMEVSEAMPMSGCPSVTGALCRACKVECDAGAHWEVRDGDRGVEAGTALGVYSCETVSPGSHFGSDVSQQALTFRYYAQLS